MLIERPPQHRVRAITGPMAVADSLDEAKAAFRAAGERAGSPQRSAW
jgi:hypothetical protein